MKPLLCTRHRARCFVSVILFNPHNSPPCWHMRAPLLRARLLHPKLLEKIPVGRGPHRGPQLHPLVFINSPAGLPLSIPSLPLQTDLCLSLQATQTRPSPFLRRDLASHSWRKQSHWGAGRFSNPGPLQPITLSTGTPQVCCEMRRYKINT